MSNAKLYILLAVVAIAASTSAKPSKDFSPKAEFACKDNMGYNCEFQVERYYLACQAEKAEDMQKCMELKSVKQFTVCYKCICPYLASKGTPCHKVDFLNLAGTFLLQNQ